MLGLSGTLLGYLYCTSWPIWLAMLAVLVVGVAGGALNGWLVTRLGLPSIAVTIGTLTLFRGLAEIMLGRPVGQLGFPSALTKIGTKPISGTQMAWSMAIFLVMAVDLRCRPARDDISAVRCTPSGCSPRRRGLPASG